MPVISRITGYLFGAFTSLAATLTPCAAEPFYQGKNISMVIGYNPGGGYDIYARIVGAAFARHIPGKPTIVPRNMPGAGSVVAANFLYTAAPKDGLTIGVIGQQLSLDQALGETSVRFDMRKFNWLGRAAMNVEVSLVWHTAPVQTLADALKTQVTLAATSGGSTSHTMPLLVSRITGAKFKLVTGYPGITGGALAMERGETQGTHATVDGLLFANANWMKQHIVSVLVQYSIKRHPSLPDVPAMAELGNTEQEKQILTLFASPAEIGRSMMMPPGVPAERVEILRHAFSSMLADPAFKQELLSKKLTFEPLDGAGLQKLIDTALSVSPELIAKAKAMIKD